MNIIKCILILSIILTCSTSKLLAITPAKESLKVLTLKAEKGDAKAQFRLGMAYIQGKEIPQNYLKAVQWFTKAANQGNSDAQFGLGMAYAYGNGVPQDYTKEIEYLTKSADQGNPHAQFYLGSLYVEGDDGVPKDYIKAVNYLTKAANQGDTESKELLKRIAQIKLFQYGDYGNSE